jgi:hypothetical protein
MKVLVGFEVLTAVVIKSTVFCDITLSSRWRTADVSEEHRLIFKVEEYAKNIPA